MTLLRVYYKIDATAESPALSCGGSQKSKSGKFAAVTFQVASSNFPNLAFLRTIHNSAAYFCQSHL